MRLLKQVLLGVVRLLSFMVNISIHENLWSEIDQLFSGYRFPNS